jgi:hypothetical protein
MANNEMPDAEQIRDIMKVLSETVPGLLEGLAKILYGAKESEEYGRAVANFFKALKESGMSNEQAYQLTRDYMSNMSLGNIVKGVASQGGDNDWKRKERSQGD